MSDKTTTAEELRGTYACPYCGRDYPHSETLHAADKSALLCLLQMGADACGRLEIIDRHEIVKSINYEVRERQIRNAINRISTNPLNRLSSRLLEDVSA